MKNVRVAVVGATGLVGQKMIQVLEERNFPVSELVPVASERSAGKQVTFRGKPVTVQPLSSTVFDGVTYALFSAGGSVSSEWAKPAAAAGAIVIDNSSAWRMHADVPLVVPEVNPETITAHQGIIANPNCSTIQMVVALKPLYDAFGIRRIVVSTYQGVTGSGKKAVDQLEDELHNGGKKNVGAYPHPIAYNCLPHIDVFYEDGYTKEEMKMVNETRKILGDDSIKISATCVRVPVIGGHSESVNIETEKPFSLEEVREVLGVFPGIILQDDPKHNHYPLPRFAHNRDEVFVGRIRRDPSIENGLNLWVVSDNLRKGAATNAVQIAEYLLKQQEQRVHA